MFPAGSGSTRASSDERHTVASANSSASTGAAIANMRLLSEPTDPLYLTSTACFVRRQLEYFAATEADEAHRRAKGGVRTPIVPGRVGIRCIHCRHLPQQDRANNYSSFPASIRLVHQAVRNYQRYHIMHCRAIPPEIMAEYERCKKERRVVPKGPMPTTGRKMTHGEYWEASCQARGLVDNGDDGIKFAAGDVVASNGAWTRPNVQVQAQAQAQAQAPSQTSVVAAVATRPSSASASQQTSGNGISSSTPLNVGNTFDALHALLGDDLEEDAGDSSPWEPDPLPPGPSISSCPTKPKLVKTDGADAVEATSSSAVVVGGRRLPLSSSQDATYLSPLVCLMRSQLEVFSATDAEVETREEMGGPVQKISVGRVGIRCVHCLDRPAAEQTKGAVSYPASIRMLNQATRNWQRFHWGSCPFIPPSARVEFDRLQAGKKTNSSRKSKECWIRQSREMGLVDTVTITRTTSSSPSYTSTDSSGTRDERTVEPEGIYFADDARKLGLQILMHAKENEVGTCEKDKNGVGATPAKHQSNKRENTVDVSQTAYRSGDATSTPSAPAENIDNKIVSSAVADAFPIAMHNSLTLDDFADDASFMSDLGRLAEDDESDSGSMDGDAPHNGSTSPHVRADESNQTDGPMIQAGISVDSTSERDLQLLTTLRATREMVRSLQEKYHGAPATGRQIAAELHPLGEALYRTLAGEDSASGMSSIDERRPMQGVNNDVRSLKRERRRDGDHPEGTASLQDLGYPTSISIFVQSLIDATDEDAVERFTAMSAVDNDLRLMIDFPDKYLFDAPPEATTGRLDMPSGLYGIQTQQNKLMNAFQSVVVSGEERHGLALVSGRSGSGKTSLVETLRSPLRDRRGNLIQIKFDKKDNQSLSSIFRALDQYCQDLQGDLDLLNEVGGAVKAALGSFGQILLSLMPNLSALIGEISYPLPTNDNKKKYHLLLSCLQTFVRAISAPSHPTVILFDDLQWADVETLGLITKLVKDAGTKSCLFVGCYRDNEVLADHPLLEYLGEIAFAGVPTWQIFLETIGRRSINELLSDTLHLLPRITAPLAREIHKKTGGNPHFAKQLLQSLYDERLVQYSPSARRWQWDLAAIRSKSVPDNAVDLLLRRMTQYGPDVQRVLQVAALMGRRFDASALKMFEAGGDGGGDGSKILVHIDTVIDDGLVCVDKAELRFAHDSIWEAAISLTPVLQRESMHLLIGRRLLRAVRNEFCANFDDHLHLIVDQMNRGFGLHEDHEEKLRLAELNLQVGHQALESASFLEASLYLLQGSALLSHEDWNSNYKLCLDIFTACAEAQLAQENYDGAIISANAVILHGTSLKDKLRSHHTIYTALYIQSRAKDACQKALSVLEELGVDLPSIDASIPRETIRFEVEKTEHLLSSTDLQKIVSRALSEDNNDAVAFTMRFLYNLTKTSYVLNPTLVPLVGCKMVQIIMEGSLTSEASIAFAIYANVLCTLGFRDRSAACAQTAMSLQDRFHGACAPDVILACNISIHPYRQPWHACLDSHERVSREAMAVGDVDSALQHQTFPCPLYIFAPASALHAGRRKLIECHGSATSSGHPNLHNATIYLQILLNLMTPRGMQNFTDPTILKGGATNQKDILSVLPQSNMYYKRLERKADFARLYLGYLFRRHDVVLEMALNVKKHLSVSTFYPTLELLLEKFHLGLAAYSIVRSGDVGDNADSWRVTADELTNEMKDLSENDSKWNFEQKYYLLEAERAFTDGDVETAATAYDKAIGAAKEHRFINEQALASERAALFYLDHGNIGQGRRYLEQSRNLYEAWGAKRKVEDIDFLLLSTIE